MYLVLAVHYPRYVVAEFARGIPFCPTNPSLHPCHQVWRDKNVVKSAPGKRKCNCKNRLVTRQIGPGMFQQIQQQVCGCHLYNVAWHVSVDSTAGVIPYGRCNIQLP